MKIEAGKLYMDGEGTIVGPMERRDSKTYQFECWVKNQYRLYTDKGKYNADGCRNLYDLVVEYHDSDDCMAYTEQKNDDTSLPLLNIFKPIRKKASNIHAEFLARANDGSYIFSVDNTYYDLERVDAENVDREFENVPDPETTKALIYLCQNVVTGDKYIRSIKPVEDKLLSTCELNYSEEDGWQVRDLKGETK